MSYQAAEQAYAEHRFAEAQQLLAEHLSQAPNDLRGLLLQGYIAFFGFEQPEQRPSATGACWSSALKAPTAS